MWFVLRYDIPALCGGEFWDAPFLVQMLELVLRSGCGLGLRMGLEMMYIVSRYFLDSIGYGLDSYRRHVGGTIMLCNGNA